MAGIAGDIVCISGGVMELTLRTGTDPGTVPFPTDSRDSCSSTSAKVKRQITQIQCGGRQHLGHLLTKLNTFGNCVLCDSGRSRKDDFFP